MALLGAAAATTPALPRAGVAAAAAAPPRAPALGTRALCAGYTGLPPGWPDDAHAGMTLVPGATFTPGSTRGYADERPAGPVTVAAFWIDRTEVTNAQFAAFVAATGYVTEAEHGSGGAVFGVPSEDELAARPEPWWRIDAAASWRRPDGAASDAAGAEARANQPAVQVTYADALAYARWRGNELPSEAEWELAARGSAADPDAAPRDARGAPAANFWQGDFPRENTAEDGFAARAPVGCFPATGAGLHDVIGNVWEWTRDLYQGPRGHAACDPGARGEAAAGGRAGERVLKGGSFLCASSFCARYRASARHPQDPTLPAAHVGFRTVRAR